MKSCNKCKFFFESDEHKRIERFDGKGRPTGEITYSGDCRRYPEKVKRDTYYDAACGEFRRRWF